MGTFSTRLHALESHRKLWRVLFSRLLLHSRLVLFVRCFSFFFASDDSDDSGLSSSSSSSSSSTTKSIRKRRKDFDIVRDEEVKEPTRNERNKSWSTKSTNDDG